MQKYTIDDNPDKGGVPVSDQFAPRIEDRIRQKVESGVYANVDAVLEEALGLLDERDQLRILRDSLVRANEQIERGEFVEWTPDLLEQWDREADELMRQGRQPKADVRP
jgi:Arc/MetJ-type ribon-helix-helix transcriptional regulator